MKKPNLTFIPALAAAFATTLLLGGIALASGVMIVSQVSRAFSVGELRIARSDRVRFSNDDKFRHQIYVESESFSFESDEQDPGTIVEINFTKVGYFEVRCHIHPKMLLTVDVHQ
jgi:plastocyanin